MPSLAKVLIFLFSAFSLHSLAQVLIFLFSAFFSWLSCSSYKIMLVSCLCVHACLLFLEFVFSLSFCACLALFYLVPTCFLIVSCCLYVVSVFCLLVFYLCVLTCFFLFKFVLKVVSFWSHYYSNIYDTTYSFGHAHQPRDMYHTTSHFALKVFFSDTWSTCSLGHNILAIFYHTSIHFALNVFFSDTILAIYTTHSSTFHTHMLYSSKFESKDCVCRVLVLIQIWV
jgi:hypothetical protein